MENRSESFDELHLEKDKGIKKYLKDDGLDSYKTESILISCNLYKFNRKNKRQHRSILVTTKHFYNLDLKYIRLISSPLKRKIEIKKIQGVIISTMSSEFTIMVPDEYDYRYSSFDQ